MSAPPVHLQIAEKWVAAMNAHDSSLLGPLCSPDASSHEMAEPKPIVGREEIVKAYRELFAAFPDCSCDIVNRVADERCVVIEMIWKGTSLGEFRGLPRTGKKIELPIAYVFEFREEKINKIREYYDGGTFLTQMGLTTQQG